MTDTTDRAPWCPRCGGEMVRPFDRPSRSGNPTFPEWTLWCDGCAFGDTHPDASTSIPDMGEAIKFVRRLVRAELARQALEMRAHSQGRVGRYDSQGQWLVGPYTLYEAQGLAQSDYNWLGAHPLRLPGEAAARAALDEAIKGAEVRDE